MNAPNPNNLRQCERPAVVDTTDDQTVYVALASVTDSGWLRVREWDGTTKKLPPQRVYAVQYLETETHGERRDDGSKAKRVADRRWRHRAQEWTADHDDGDHPVIADD